PIDMSGTYPLPEAQLDRFLMRLSVGYPDHVAEVSVLVDAGTESVVDGLPCVIDAAEVGELNAFASRLHVEPAVYYYIVSLVAATRDAPGVRLGASPRASVALLRAARAWAAASGRGYVTPDDVKTLAVHVLAHRIVVKAEAMTRGRGSAEVVEEVLAGVPAPPQTVVAARG